MQLAESVQSLKKKYKKFREQYIGAIQKALQDVCELFTCFTYMCACSLSPVRSIGFGEDYILQPNPSWANHCHKTSSTGLDCCKGVLVVKGTLADH